MTYTRKLSVVFAFMKVKGMRKMPDQEMFQEMAMQAFTGPNRLGFTSLLENRQAGMSCRAWLKSMLAMLMERGYLDRNESPQWFEDEITKVKKSHLSTNQSYIYSLRSANHRLKISSGSSFDIPRHRRPACYKIL
ncbi:hypothetical protein IW262DRAFT_861043 [Armillaria fumosa]|nr:hypothetical protein IW262DRAFT_861043 [Armillaria fumosa]